jgi:transcriptional regulator GlxA family with amidase domain
MTTYAILIYDGVEPIDLGATFGVLSMARRIAPSISMFAVAGRAGAVRCANGLTVMADYSYSDCPPFDALVVTGGPGWPDAAGDEATRNFIEAVHPGAALAAICTGAMILAAAGRLDGRSATTKVEVVGSERSPLAVLSENYPRVQTKKAAAVLSDGVLTSGGVSLGIDGVLYLIGTLEGPHVMRETARILEYGRALEANARALPPVGLDAAG